MTDEKFDKLDAGLPLCGLESQEPQSPEEFPEFDLRFPQLMLKASFESLLSNSRILSTSQDTAMERSRKKHDIHESWTALERSDKDQEDDTESVVDIQSTSDMQSVSDDLTSEESDLSGDDDDSIEIEDEVVRGDYTQPEAHNDLADLVQNAVSNSQSTIRNSTLSSDTDHLLSQTYPENMLSTSNPRVQEYCKVIKNFSPNTKNTSPYDSSEATLKGTIRMPLANTGLELDAENTFNLLLFDPMHDLEVRHKVVGKFAAAVGWNCLSVQHCDFARKVIDGRLGDQTIILQNTEEFSAVFSVKRGDHFSVTGENWNAPSLAVVMVGDNLAEFDESRENMIEFLRRHFVPYMLITTNTDWSATEPETAQPFDALQRCLETYVDGASGFQVVKKFPIDLASFVKVEAHTFNKHLAFVVFGLAMDKVPLASREKVVKLKKRQSRVQMSPMRDIVTSLKQMFFILLPVLVLSTIIALCMSLTHWLYSTPKVLTIDPLSTSGQVESCTALLNKTRSSVLVPTAWTGNTVEKDLDHYRSTDASTVASVHSTVTTSAISQNSTVKSPSQEYRIEQVGKQHVFVKLHGSLRRRLHTENFHVSAQRDQKSIDVRMDGPFGGLFVVEVPPHEAYGVLALTLRFQNHEPLDVVSVDLGEKNPATQSRKTAKPKLDILSGAVGSIILDQIEGLKRIWAGYEGLPNIETHTIELVHKTQDLLNHIPLVVELRKIPQHFAFDLSGSGRVSNVTAELWRDLDDLASKAQVQVVNGWHLCSKFVDKGVFWWQHLNSEEIPKMVEKVQDVPRSENLATAQGRAFWIVKAMRERFFG